MQRAGEFRILLEDVSITHLTFGKVWFHIASASGPPSESAQEFTQAVEAKQIAQQGNLNLLGELAHVVTFI
jgi:prohibitin 1